MSKTDKIYRLEDKEDFIVYLELLIEFVFKNFKRYKIYFKEIEDLTLLNIRKFDPFITEISEETIEIIISSSNYFKVREQITLDYDELKQFDDKISGVNIRLLNAFGDRTKEAMSYFKFRDEIKKRRKKMDKQKKNNVVIIDELDQEHSEILNAMYKSRNYVAHLPDTKFISQQKYREEQLRRLSIPYKPSETIIINMYESIDIEYLWQSYNSYKTNYESFHKMFERLKYDYSTLIGKKTKILINQETKYPFEFMDISKQSIDMHLNKKNKN